MRCRERPPCRSPDAPGIGKPAALRRRAIHESPLRVGAVWTEMKTVGNAVPGVPGDPEGRPYAMACKSVQFYRLGIVHIAEVSLRPLTIT